MKPLVLKQNTQSEPPKVSIDMAEQIADRAARRAADDVSRENNQQNRQVPFEKDSIYEEPEGGYSIDTKTEKNLIRRLLDQTLQKALDPPPPSPIENAVNTVMNTVSAGIAEKMLGNIGGAGVGVSKPSILIDILNTAAAHGFGESLGNNLPQVIQSLSGAIGHQKTQELASAATKAMSQTQGEQQNNNNPDLSNAEKQKDMVLALDSSNIEHIKQYANAMGLSEKAAKGMLQIHQDDILSERKGNQVNNQGNNQGNNQNINNEISQALGIIIQEMAGMKNTINNLQSEISGIRAKKVDEDVGVIEPESDDRKWTNENESFNVSKSPFGVAQKSVTLFQTPIHVNVDDIKGDTNSFFKEPSSNKVSKVEKQKESEEPEEPESVLEEVVDDEGKSTFKMSDKKEQPKKVTEIIDKEEDKKKESSSVDLINENTDTTDVKKSEKIDEKIEKIDEKIEKIDEKIDEKTGKNPKWNIENIDELPKIDKKIIRKKIIRKPFSIEETKETQELPVKQDHYDIDNNLMEDTT